MNAFPHGILLDYDGTLTPIVCDPTAAHLGADGCDLLRALCRAEHLRVAIVSGRTVGQLLGFLGQLAGERLLLAGMHGGELYDLAAGQFLLQPSASIPPAVERFTGLVKPALAEAGVLDGLIFEEKVYSLTMHTRPVSATQAQAAMRIFEHVAAPYLADGFRLLGGKALIELMPKDFHKGVCVNALSDAWQTRQLLMAGDDLTDEYAFAAVNALGGCSILVGDHGQPTVATERLPDIPALFERLRFLLANATLVSGSP
jgi:trehalose 6-phosphate phosphatase